MTTSRSNKIYSNGKSFQLVTALLLLCVYFAGTSELTTIHILIHGRADEITLHSEINEANSCHQSLFHNARKKSCDHQAHILAIKKCSLCQLSIQTFHLAAEKSPVAANLFSELQPKLEIPVFQSELYSLLPPRSPPFGMISFR